jgi:hypothetical protein
VEAGDAGSDADAGACFTAARVGLVGVRAAAGRGGPGTFADAAGATIVPATIGAAGRRRPGASGNQRAAAERVRTKPAA